MKMKIEEVLDWLTEVEWFFDVMEIPTKNQVKLVVISLKGAASVWWDQLVMLCCRQQCWPVLSLLKMKKLLRK